MRTDSELHKCRQIVAAVGRYLATPPGDRASMLELASLATIGGLSDARLESEMNGEGPLVVSFRASIRGHENDPPPHCLCDGGAFALLLVIVAFGGKAFLNNNSDGRPYLKIDLGGGRSKGGFMLTKLIADPLDGESVHFRNGNQLDLRYANLKIGRGRPATRADQSSPLIDGDDRATPAILGAIIIMAMREASFVGDHAAVSGLLFAVRERMAAECDPSRWAA